MLTIIMLIGLAKELHPKILMIHCLLIKLSKSFALSPDLFIAILTGVMCRLYRFKYDAWTLQFPIFRLAVGESR